jgi:hypothetical protein
MTSRPFHILTQKLWICIRAERIIAETRFWILLRKSAFAAVGLGLLLLAIVMFNIAAFQTLASSWGAVRTPIYLGLVDIVLALALMWAAWRVKPGRELIMAEEIRNTALASLQSEMQLWSPASLVGRAISGETETKALQILVQLISLMIRSIDRRTRTPPIVK